jgi:hypothetical protein
MHSNDLTADGAPAGQAFLSYCSLPLSLSPLLASRLPITSGQQGYFDGFEDNEFVVG